VLKSGFVHAFKQNYSSALLILKENLTRVSVLNVFVNDKVRV
jgi:hypothetical protein